MKQIKNIIFDIGNVLVDFCWKSAFENMKLSDEMWERLRLATVGNDMWNQFDKGILEEDEIVAGFIAADPEIESVIMDFMENHYHEIVRKFDYADEWIKSLKEEGYGIYFLSNFSKKGFQVFKDELDFVKLGDGAVISYEAQQIKPFKDIYITLLDTYNLKPEECVFIDDTAANIETAKELSFNTIRFISRNQAVEELDKLLQL